MVIRLDEYRRKKAALRSASRPDQEWICGNWNTASVIALSLFQKPQEPGTRLPEDTAAAEAAFMDRIYALASQI